MDHTQQSSERSSRDRGMTLIELLISIAVLGTITSVIGVAVIVTIRQQADTEARLDVARWEQSLALWLPSDLASATTVSALKDDEPCTTDPACSYGSNALQLSWNDGAGETIVSYRYGPAPGGQSFELHRVVCTAGSCIDRVVLRDLAVPSDDDGNPIAWAAGDDVPDTVINVTVPLAVGSSSCDPTATPPDPDCDNDTRAQRVIVNVNGSPGSDGIDRSSTVSFTAGGSSLSTLEPATFSGPSFLQANSGCGGPITLVVDESASLYWSDIYKIRDGVRSFVKAFDGTPTNLQIITFSNESYTLGTGSWNRFFDLADPSDVTDLIGPTGDSGLVDNITRRSGTNWEAGLYHAYFTQDGQTYEEAANPAAPMPEMVVFFTDGEPTRDRASGSSYKNDTSSIEPPSIPSRFNYTTAGNDSAGRDYAPRGWYRADYIVDQFRDIRFIGVGVGNAFTQSREVKRSGWPFEWRYWYGWYKDWTNIPREVFLGDLAAGGDPSQYGTSASGGYVMREYNSTDGWGDVSNANLLVTDDWDEFGGALTQIALAECGGTLTVQTRDSAGDPADASITYQIGDEVVTTTRIAKAATFDIPLEGIPSATVELVPQSFDGTGYTPSSWNCRAGGADLTEGSDWNLITPGVPVDGISVDVSANAAVSCTLSVTP